MKKINKILIGTHNLGKFREISNLLPKKLIKISPKNLNIKEPKETGKSFRENSILKAKYFQKKSGLPTISDDSGLEIKCLNNKPGIHSARWAKKQGSFDKAMKNILKKINHKNKFSSKKINRQASFICSLTYICNKRIVRTVVGKINGYISEQIKGKNGFGYDPIFIPLGQQKTFGQMAKKKKMMTDHRYEAFRKLKKKLPFLK